MQSLLKIANVYIGSKKQEGFTANHAVLHGIAKYLTRLLKIFGANDGEQEIGFPVSGIGGSENVIFDQYFSLLYVFLLFPLIFTLEFSKRTKTEERTLKQQR